ncbi:MAG: RHS repeat domain-containing protein [Pyrinomonadaceae bacterium]
MFYGEINGDFKGAVKEVESRTFTVSESDGQTSEQVESTEIRRYNRSGKLLFFAHTVPGKNSVQTTYLYDPNDRMIGMSEGDGQSVQNKWEFSYDADGRLTELRFYDGKDNLLSVNRSVFIKNGLRVEEGKSPGDLYKGRKILGTISFTIASETKVGFSNKNIDCWKTFYDAEEKPVEVSFYNVRKRLIGKMFVIYNAQGNPAEAAFYGDDPSFQPNNLKSWAKFLYPVLEKLNNFLLIWLTFCRLALRQEYKNAFRCLIYGVPFRSTTFVYDEKGKKIETRDFSPGFPGDRTVYRYNENGEVSEVISYADDGFVWRQQPFEYEYDRRNNWIKKTTVEKIPLDHLKKVLEFKIVTSRTIKYF